MYKNGLIRKRLILKFVTSQSGKKQLQFTYCPISEDVKATRQCRNQTKNLGTFKRLDEVKDEKF